MAELFVVSLSYVELVEPEGSSRRGTASVRAVALLE